MFWRQVFLQKEDSGPSVESSNCKFICDFDPQIKAEYWKEKLHNERQDYSISLALLQKENSELKQCIKQLIRDQKLTKGKTASIIGVLEVADDLFTPPVIEGNSIPDSKNTVKGLTEIVNTKFSHCDGSENFTPNKPLVTHAGTNTIDDQTKDIEQLGFDVDLLKNEVVSLQDRLQQMTEDKKVLRSKCKAHIVKLNEKIISQDKIIRRLEEELITAKKLHLKILNVEDNTKDQLSTVVNVRENIMPHDSAPMNVDRTSCIPSNDRNLFELRLSKSEIQLMKGHDVNALLDQNNVLRDNPESYGSEQELLCVLGILQDKYDKLKASFSEKTHKLSEKVRSLQSALLTKVNENKAIKYQNKQLEVRIQACQKDFGSIKSKLIGMRDDQVKYLSQYESQISSLKKELSEKSKELERLQIVVKNDKERFSRMKSSIHKIVALNKPSSSADSNGTLHEEMHRIYVQEIHKRFDEQEIQDLDDLTSSLSSIKHSLADTISTIALNDETDYEMNTDQIYRAALSAVGMVPEDSAFSEGLGQRLSDHILHLMKQLEEKSEECCDLVKETQILRDRLNQLESRFDVSKFAHSSEWSQYEGGDIISESFDTDSSKIGPYTLRIIELETKITHLQQEISTLSRITPIPTPNKSY